MWQSLMTIGQATLGDSAAKKERKKKRSKLQRQNCRMAGGQHSWRAPA